EETFEPAHRLLELRDAEGARDAEGPLGPAAVLPRHLLPQLLGQDPPALERRLGTEDRELLAPHGPANGPDWTRTRWLQDSGSRPHRRGPRGGRGEVDAGTRRAKQCLA